MFDDAVVEPAVALLAVLASDGPALSWPTAPRASPRRSAGQLGRARDRPVGGDRRH